MNLLEGACHDDMEEQCGLMEEVNGGTLWRTGGGLLKGGETRRRELDGSSRSYVPCLLVLGVGPLICIECS